MLAVEIIKDVANTQLHSQAGRKARRAWQLSTIMQLL